LTRVQQAFAHASAVLKTGPIVSGSDGWRTKKCVIILT